MYTEYFGLEQEPFRARFEGPGTYVGPQQARALSRISRALATPDAVVTVSGPVGIGKTTLVVRAVQVVAPDGRIARIGRMRLGPDEIVELLLTQFGVSRQPSGIIQRFAAFKRLLDECNECGSRAFIVVEDARRLGIDALIELEAMTAADGGSSGTANIILMGDSELQTFLADPLLQRLAQRTRMRQTIAPFSVDELRDYLRHCLHLAGGEFDAIFEAGSVEMLHQCSDGIPRIVNNICETALAEAADADANRVTVELLRDIARDVYAIDTLPPELVAPHAGEADEVDDLQQDEAFFSAGEYEPGDVETSVAADLDDDSPTGVNAALNELPDEFPGFETDDAQAEAVDETPPAGAEQPDDVVAFDDEPEMVADAPVADDEAIAGFDEAVEEELSVSAFSPSPEITIVDRTGTRTVVPLNARAFASAGIAPDMADPESAGDDVVAAGIAAWHEDSPEVPATTGDSTEADRASPDVPEAAVETPREPAGDGEAAAESVATTPEPEPLVPEPGGAAPEADAGTSVGDVDENVGEVVDCDDDTHEVRVLDDILDDTAAVLALDAESRELADEDIPVLTDSVRMRAPEFDPPAADEPLADEHDIDTLTPESEEFSAALDELEVAISSANEPHEEDRGDEAASEAAPEFEITLDRNIEERPAEDVSRWQQELANAKSLEEMSDMLAETVFGDKDFDRIAAEVASNPPPVRESVAPDEPSLEEPAPEPVTADAADDDIGTGAAPAGDDAAHGMTGGFSMSISQRFEVLRKIGSSATKPNDNVVEITLGEERAEAPPGLAPEPIESQIDTAITQSRLALSDADVEKMRQEEAGSAEKQSTGLFGLFKRSSKN